MLAAFSLKNFKSFQLASLPLRPLTVLIGANASGKTNLIESLQLLAWMGQGRELAQLLSDVRDGEIGLRGSLPQLSADPQQPIELSVTLADPTLVLEVEFTVEDVGGPRIVRERLSSEVGLIYEATLESASPGMLRVAYDNFSRTGKPTVEATSLRPVFAQLDSPASFGGHFTPSRTEIPAATRRIVQALREVYVLDPVPRRMRGYVHRQDTKLRVDGANLSAVLHALDAGGRAELLAFVRALPEQDISDIAFIETPRDEVMVQLVETFGGVTRTQDADGLSDGTLRVLAIAAALLSAPSGATLVFEELDNGIHPPRIADILERMRSIAHRRGVQVVITTHNPTLLDAIASTELEHVMVCYRDPEHGHSRLLRLGDYERFAELMSAGRLGAVVTRGVLERLLHDRESPAAKSERAQAWLRSIGG